MTETLLAMGQALGTIKDEKINNKKGGTRMKQESAEASAPDLIPDDLFFMNFDCSRVVAKRRKVKLVKHKML